MANNLYQQLDELITQVTERLEGLQEAINQGIVENAEGAHMGISDFFTDSLTQLDVQTIALLNDNQREQLMNRAFQFPDIDFGGGVFEGFHVANNLQLLFDEHPFQPNNQAQNQEQQIFEIAPAAGGSKRKKTRSKRKAKKTRKAKKSLKRK